MILSNPSLRNNDPFPLKLPREHGAVGVFSLTTLMSLCLCPSNLVGVATGLALLWLMMTAKDNFRLLASISLFSILAFSFTGCPLAAVFVFAVFCALQFLQHSNNAKEFWWREIFGLTGAVLAPLMLTAFLSDASSLLLLAGTCFLAVVFTGVAIIHALRPELKIGPCVTASLALLFWILLAIQNMLLAVLCLLPFLVQGAWIARNPRPGYKELGIAQICSLFFSAAMLLFCR